MNTTNQRIKQLKESRERWKAKAQLMEKVSWGLSIAVIVLVTALIVLAVSNKAAKAEEKSSPATTTAIQTTIEIDEPEPEESYMTYIGDYIITYYCSCTKCCGKWGEDRPNVNGKETVVTSSGAFAQEGITIAVDPDKIPYGSTVYIEGVGYRIAQDCGGAIKGNKIDVYMDSHQECLENGIHEAKVYIMTGGNNNG